MKECLCERWEAVWFVCRETDGGSDRYRHWKEIGINASKKAEKISFE
jgi:hypothetical protein